MHESREALASSRLVDQQLHQAQGEPLIERHGGRADIRRFFREHLLDGRKLVRLDERLVKIALDPDIPRPRNLDGALNDPPWRFHKGRAPPDRGVAIREIKKHRADDLFLQIHRGGIVADPDFDGDFWPCRSFHEPEH